MKPNGTGADDPPPQDQDDEVWRLNRALRTLSAGNRALLRAADEPALLQAMCQVIVEEGGYRLAYVAFAQHDEHKTLAMQAYAIQREDPAEREFFDHLQLTWADVALGQHAAAIAIRSGTPCVGRHLLTDPGHAPWRADAIRLGYSSVSAFPLLMEDGVAGALLIADSDPDAFDESEIKLLGELSEDLAYGIANLRNRIRRREAEATLARTAFFDTLTGLPNRALFRSRVQAAIDTARHERRALAVLHLSVSHYQEVGDVLGSLQADLLAGSCARQLEKAVREGQFVACVGEGEFALLLPQTDVGEAVHVAHELVRQMSGPVEIGGLSISTGLCAGIAAFPGHGTDADALVRRARMAMFDARRRRTDCTVFSAALEEQRSARLALMIDLRRAIERKALQLYCQPKIDLATRRICGAEGLVRWEHPSQGMIPTEEFVRIAETSGLITPSPTAYSKPPSSKATLGMTADSTSRCRSIFPPATCTTRNWLASCATCSPPGARNPSGSSSNSPKAH